MMPKEMYVLLKAQSLKHLRTSEQPLSAGRINLVLLIPGLMLLALGTEMAPTCLYDLTGTVSQTSNS